MIWYIVTYVAGVASGGFVAFKIADTKHKFDRAKRGWKRRI